MKNQSALLILLAAILWGTTGTAQTFAPEDASPVVVGAIRIAIGGPALLLLAYFSKKLNWHRWKLSAVIIAAIGVALFQPFFFSGVQETGVALGTVVAIGSAPIITGLLEWIFMKKRPSRAWGLATVLAVIGCMLLLLTGEEMNVRLLGIMYALGAGLSFAVYTLMSKQLLEVHEPEAVMGVIFTLGAIFLLPVFIMFPVSPLFSVSGILIALYLGLFTTALAYLLFSKGLLGVPASTAITLSLAEPLTATMLGVIVVGETLTITAWFGVLLLFIGLGILSFRRA